MLKIIVRWLDVYTITWFRFFVAGLVLLPFAWRDLRSLTSLRGVSLVLLGASLFGLTGNYLTFMGGLTFISPGTAQVVIQLSPMSMLLAGLVLFRESFAPRQWLGVAVLLAGQVIFFQPRYGQLIADFETEGIGVVLIFSAALLWGLYMVTQKQLLQVLRAEVILVVIYLGGSTLILPMAEIETLQGLPTLGVALLIGSALLTSVSYLTFAQALHHIEASRIGVLVALTPVFVVINMELLTALWPGLLPPENLSPTSIIGGLVVVAGSILAGWRRS